MLEYGSKHPKYRHLDHLGIFQPSNMTPMITTCTLRSTLFYLLSFARIQELQASASYIQVCMPIHPTLSLHSISETIHENVGVRTSHGNSTGRNYPHPPLPQSERDQATPPTVLYRPAIRGLRLGFTTRPEARRYGTRFRGGSVQFARAGKSICAIVELPQALDFEGIS